MVIMMHVRSENNFRGIALTLRGRSGLSQTELATLLGVSARAIQKWEAGLTYPSAGNLQEPDRPLSPARRIHRRSGSGGGTRTVGGDIRGYSARLQAFRSALV